MKLVALAVAVAAAIALSADARPVKWWGPDELSRRADAIVVASPVEVSKTDRESSIRIGEDSPVPTIVLRARLRVDHVIRGNVPADIDFRFSQVDEGKVGDRYKDNGPNRIGLRTGAVYVLYLMRDLGNEGAFVSALEGEYDDEQAVVRITSMATEPPAGAFGVPAVQP
jgi:hypothetical protein